MWSKSSINLFVVLVILVACQNTVTNTPQPDVTESATAVSLPCAGRQGKLTRVELGSQHLDETVEVNIYLPPCYDTHPDQRYPVLYLLHGAGLDIDTWPRLGAAEVADQLIASGEIEPLIIIMPPSLNFFEDGFDPVFLDDVVPYVEAHYRTLPDRQHRALGGMSVGGLPTLRVGLQHPELFGTLGIHSLADAKKSAQIETWLDNLPPDKMPRFYLDIGRDDPLLHTSHGNLQRALITRNIPHQSIERDGDHRLRYWAKHLPEYLRWYDEQFTAPPLAYYRPAQIHHPPPPCNAAQGEGDTFYVTGQNSQLLGQVNVYLPPCYAEHTETAYPVLYLLHGGGMNEFSWYDLGTVDIAGELMQAGEVAPFILVMPPSVDYGPEFEALFLNEVSPKIDGKYRTIATRPGRAIGGISAGAVLAARIAFQHPELFGAVGLHSTAEPYGQREAFDTWLTDIPPELMPQLYLDIGVDDDQLGSHQFFVDLLKTGRVPHLNLIRTGWHSLDYWAENMEEYIRWYALAFGAQEVVDSDDGP